MGVASMAAPLLNYRARRWPACRESDAVRIDGHKRTTVYRDAW